MHIPSEEHFFFITGELFLLMQLKIPGYLKKVFCV